MRKFAFAGVGVAVGFVSALALFPAAQGATNVLSAYRELDLFGDAFERVRANYVREVDDSELINSAINLPSIFANFSGPCSEMLSRL